MSNVLALDISGIPRTWVNHDEAITYHAKGLVAWTLGDIVARYHGGLQNDGTRSYLETPSIIAVRGTGFDFRKHNRVILTNRTLFARDKNMCLYCGEHHIGHQYLSRDHIVPRVHGGEDTWTNVATACKRCNQKKGCKSLKEAHMELLCIPYVPNRYEHLILQNRHILTDQMEFLITGVSRNFRL